MLEKALKGSKRYWAFIALLAAAALPGLYFYYLQLTQGLAITGMSRDVSWGLYISQFTFFVGVAASAVMVVIPYYLHQLDRVSGTAHFEVPVETGVRLVQQLRARLPGYAVPRYVREIPGEPNKVVLA